MYPGYSETPFVDRNGIEFTEIRLPLPPMLRSKMCPTTSLPGKVFFLNLKSSPLYPGLGTHLRDTELPGHSCHCFILETDTKEPNSCHVYISADQEVSDFGSSRSSFKCLQMSGWVLARFVKLWWLIVKILIQVFRNMSD